MIYRINMSVIYFIVYIRIYVIVYVKKKKEMFASIINLNAN